jgi:hypothetical protein
MIGDKILQCLNIKNTSSCYEYAKALMHEAEIKAQSDSNDDIGMDQYLPEVIDILKDRKLPIAQFTAQELNTFKQHLDFYNYCSIPSFSIKSDYIFSTFTASLQYLSDLRELELIKELSTKHMDKNNTSSTTDEDEIFPEILWGNQEIHALTMDIYVNVTEPRASASGAVDQSSTVDFHAARLKKIREIKSAAQLAQINKKLNDNNYDFLPSCLRENSDYVVKIIKAQLELTKNKESSFQDMTIITEVITVAIMQQQCTDAIQALSKGEKYAPTTHPELFPAALWQRSRDDIDVILKIIAKGPHTHPNLIINNINKLILLFLIHNQCNNASDNISEKYPIKASDLLPIDIQNNPEILAKISAVVEEATSNPLNTIHAIEDLILSQNKKQQQQYYLAYVLIALGTIITITFAFSPLFPALAMLILSLPLLSAMVIQGLGAAGTISIMGVTLGIILIAVGTVYLIPPQKTSDQITDFFAQNSLNNIPLDKSEHNNCFF